VDISIINNYFEDEETIDQQEIMDYNINIDEKKEEIKQLLRSNIIKSVDMIISFYDEIELRDFTIGYINDNYFENYFDCGEFNNKKDAIKFYFILRYKLLLNYIILYTKRFKEYNINLIMKSDNEAIDLYKFILTMSLKNKQEKYHNFLFNLLCNYSIRKFWIKYLRDYIMDFYIHII
jgi:hypothetical protein